MALVNNGSALCACHIFTPAEIATLQVTNKTLFNWYGNPNVTSNFQMVLMDSVFADLNTSDIHNMVQNQLQTVPTAVTTDPTLVNYKGLGITIDMDAMTVNPVWLDPLNQTSYIDLMICTPAGSATRVGEVIHSHHIPADGSPATVYNPLTDGGLYYVDPVTLAETIVIRLGAVQHDPSIPLPAEVQEPFTPPEPSKPCIVFDDVDDPTVLDVEVPAGVPITTVVTSQFELSPTFANGPRGQRIRLKRRSLTAALNMVEPTNPAWVKSGNNYGINLGNPVVEGFSCDTATRSVFYAGEFPQYSSMGQTSVYPSTPEAWKTLIGIPVYADFVTNKPAMYSYVKWRIEVDGVFLQSDMGGDVAFGIIVSGFPSIGYLFGQQLGGVQGYRDIFHTGNADGSINEIRDISTKRNRRVRFVPDQAVDPTTFNFNFPENANQTMFIDEEFALCMCFSDLSVAPDDFAHCYNFTQVQLDAIVPFNTYPANMVMNGAGKEINGLAIGAQTLDQFYSMTVNDVPTSFISIAAPLTDYSVTTAHDWYVNALAGNTSKNSIYQPETGLTLGFGGTFGQRSFAFRYIAGQGDPEVATIRICSRVPTLDPLAPNASTATSSPFVTDYLGEGPRFEGHLNAVQNVDAEGYETVVMKIATVVPVPQLRTASMRFVPVDAPAPVISLDIPELVYPYNNYTLRATSDDGRGIVVLDASFNSVGVVETEIAREGTQIARSYQIVATGSFTVDALVRDQDDNEFLVAKTVRSVAPVLNAPASNQFLSAEKVLIGIDFFDNEVIIPFAELADIITVSLAPSTFARQLPSVDNLLEVELGTVAVPTDTVLTIKAMFKDGEFVSIDYPITINP